MKKQACWIIKYDASVKDTHSQMYCSECGKKYANNRLDEGSSSCSFCHANMVIMHNGLERIAYRYD